MKGFATRNKEEEGKYMNTEQRRKSLLKLKHLPVISRIQMRNGACLPAGWVHTWNSYNRAEGIELFLKKGR